MTNSDDHDHDLDQVERDGQLQATDEDVEFLIGDEVDPPDGLDPVDPTAFEEVDD